jgi:transcription elongation factor GreA
MADKQKLTKAGYKKLQDELKYLVDVAREEIKVQLAEARAQGDLSENADYDAARGKQAEVEGRIKEIENILANADIIEESKASTKKVGLGSTVTIRYVDEDRKDQSFMIVGTVESDPVNGKISNSCPLGEALVGKTVGDIVEVKAIRTYKVEILKIEIK